MKATKESVNYRPAEAAERCAGCKNFAPPQSCGVVDGVVSPDGLCDAFVPLSEVEAGNAPQPGSSANELMSMFSGPMTTR
jgi:hypothetical protein